MCDCVCVFVGGVFVCGVDVVMWDDCGWLCGVCVCVC